LADTEFFRGPCEIAVARRYFKGFECIQWRQAARHLQNLG
jgi:hypothetical protein